MAVKMTFESWKPMRRIVSRSKHNGPDYPIRALKRALGRLFRRGKVSPYGTIVKYRIRQHKASLSGTSRDMNFTNNHNSRKANS